MATVFATTTVQVSAGGAPLMIRKGSHWSDDDPVVIDHPDVFSTDARFGMSTSTGELPDEPVIEAATAAPGERRNVRRLG